MFISNVGEKPAITKKMEALVNGHSMLISYNFVYSTWLNAYSIPLTLLIRDNSLFQLYPSIFNMIIPGRSLITRSIIRNIQSPTIQVQPCGVDATLKRIFKWTSSGTIDFDNKLRQTASTEEIPFSSPADKTITPHLDLLQGSYLVEFNETISVPLDAMGQIFVRSSLFRSGVLINGGVIDSGYEGVVGAMMQVLNPAGLRVYPSARLAQFVFHHMSERTEGYNGVYQGSIALG